MPISLNTIARAVGVSHATVSFIFNRRAGLRFRPETIRKVQATAKRLGYDFNRLNPKQRRRAPHERLAGFIGRESRMGQRKETGPPGKGSMALVRGLAVLLWLILSVPHRSEAAYSTATAVTAGVDHTCAIVEGTVQCWGAAFGPTPLTVTGITTTPIAVAAGLDYTCALLANGTIKCWGSNASGKLGDGTTTNSATPVTVTGITTATAVATGQNHTCARLSNGTVQCWGRNFEGELGTGATSPFSATPVTVTGITTATAIAAGGLHSCAVLLDGTVQCWGSNFGPTPVAVTGITTATAIAAGGSHTCALLANGTVQCWGFSFTGQLGNGTSDLSFHSTPVAVTGITTATAIAAGVFGTCARLSDGTVQCWGDNGLGDLGIGTNTGPQSCFAEPCSTTPLTVTGITTAIAVTIGGHHACALLAVGAIKCWGSNASLGGAPSGQLGTGTTTGPQSCFGFACSPTPVTVTGITTATAVTAGVQHTCAIVEGTAQCWGTGFGPIPLTVTELTPAATQVGNLVTVSPPGTGVSVTFTTVQIGGSTLVTISGTGPSPPAGFVLGSPGRYYDIATTATVTAPITVCINYSGITFPGPPALFHFQSGAWVNVTTSVNPATTTICGSVTSLSPFALFVPVDTTPPVIVPTVTPAPNAAGWNNTDVTVSWNVTDPESGVASSIGCSRTTLTAETSGTVVTCAATDGAGLSASASVTVKIDKTPPTITVTRTPAPNVAGWNNTDVTVTFTCADTGSGIATCPAPVTVTTEGAGQVITRTAVDVAGNSTAASVTVNLDKTPPTLTFGPATPAPNAAGWNNTNVSLAFIVADALSGVASTSLPSPLILSAEGSAVTGQVTVTDVAGNSATFTSPAVKIDKTPPTITVTRTPAPNVAGWNNTDVTVTFTCADSLSGVATCAAPTTVSTEGANQSVSGGATDRAGNAASLTVTVNLDKTPPEAVNQFDPATQDVVVFGRDALSGVPPGPIAPFSVVSTRWGNGDEDEKGDEERAELRTYQVQDRAGNTLVVVEKVKREGHALKARIVSLQYNAGPVLTAPPNQKAFEWAFAEAGLLKELEQQLKVGRGHAKHEVEAHFEGQTNQTTIKVGGPMPETKVVKPGLVLLQLVTSKGMLVIEF